MRQPPVQLGALGCKWLQTRAVGGRDGSPKPPRTADVVTRLSLAFSSFRGASLSWDSTRRADRRRAEMWGHENLCRRRSGTEVSGSRHHFLRISKSRRLYEDGVGNQEVQRSNGACRATRPSSNHGPLVVDELFSPFARKWSTSWEPGATPENCSAQLAE